MILKISNLRQDNGVYDYKGLDVNQFVSGSQVYPNGFDSVFLMTKEEVIPTHIDIVVIPQSEYDAEKLAFQTSLPKSLDEELAEVKQIQADQDVIIMNLLLGGI